MKSTILVLLALTMSGCAASGKLYTDTSRDSTILDPTKGRITAFRTTKTIVAAGRDALITVDNAAAKFVAYGGFASIDVVEGIHLLNVAMASDKHRCEINFSIKLHEELFFEVAPLSGRIISEAVTGNLSPGLSSINCDGYFSIVPVDRIYAQKQLENIRESAQ